MTACGSSSSGPSKPTHDGGSDTGTHDATTKPDTGMTTINPDSGPPPCVPSTCTELNANCGAVTDPKCGGIVMCGSCTAPDSCGGGGTHNQCGNGGGDGGHGDGCAKLTCESQMLSCGQAGDGCGGTISCGSCMAPLTCGGNPSTPGQCGCTGTCASIPHCEAGTTTLSGKVYDPAGTNGLYNALVYVPNDTTDPGLQPFNSGITCGVCGATAAGSPLVNALTAPDGTFTLTNVPVGGSVPLVIQLGRWRRQFTVNVATSCGANTIPDKMLEMPSNHTQGDLPRIAIVTGAFDPVECVLLKMGVDPTEFSDPGGPGYIQLYTADDADAVTPGTGAGAVYSAQTPSQDALFGGPISADGGAAPLADGGTPQIDNYDITILECEGYANKVSAAQQAALANYAGSGGRIFASDFQYSWFYQNPGLEKAANWSGNHSGNGFGVIGLIDQAPSNPIGKDFQKWLEDVQVNGADAGSVSISPSFQNVTAVVPPTQEWLHSTGTSEGGTTNTPIHFTFNTPISSQDGGPEPAANQCGRVTFSDWHAESANHSNGKTFPAECTNNALTAQESILEFMLFDLSACVQPYTPICASQTCEQQGIECGPAGDGCGNTIQCGTCTTGMSCGGGGHGKCGMTTVPCPPETCMSQSIQCGPAGDGCGNEIQCGDCPTDYICGLTMPGQCAKPAP